MHLEQLEVAARTRGQVLPPLAALRACAPAFHLDVVRRAGTRFRLRRFQLRLGHPVRDCRPGREGSPGDEPGLVEEHAPALFIEGEVCGEDLAGDGTVENGVLGLPNHTHPALADLLDDR